MNFNSKDKGKTSPLEIGTDNDWSMHKSYSRYKKQLPYKLPSDRFKELYGKMMRLHSQSPKITDAEKR